LGDQIEKNEVGRHVARGGGGGEKRDEFRILVRKPEGRDHLEDPGIILIY